MNHRRLIASGIATLLLGAAALGVARSQAGTDDTAPTPVSDTLPAEPPRFLDDLKPVFHFDTCDKPDVVPTDSPPCRSTKGDPTSELIALLNETQSFDTFFVTVNLLEDMGADAKPAIPVIVRNAERLGVFKNHYPKGGPEGDMVELIYKKLKGIREAQPEAPKEQTGIRPAVHKSSAGARLGAIVGAVVGDSPRAAPACSFR